MTYKFTINGTLPNLNDLIKCERIQIRTRNGGFTTKGNELKKKTQNFIISQIRRDLKNLSITDPIYIKYRFYEPNMKRDLDNIASFAMKCTQDSLVLARVIPNDGWKNIVGFDCKFAVDKERPRIEVELIVCTHD